MIKVWIRYMGFLQVDGVENERWTELPEGMTVNQLLDLWGIAERQKPFFTPYVNQEKRDLGHELKEGDSLFLYLPVGGG